MEWMILPLKRYAEFSGRSRRKEYWMFMLLNAIVYAVGIGMFLAGLPWSQMGEAGANGMTGKPSAALSAPAGPSLAPAGFAVASGKPGAPAAPPANPNSGDYSANGGDYSANGAGMTPYAPAPAAANPFEQLGLIGWLGLGLLALWVLATFIPNIAVHVRRFHDQDKSGWMYLLNFIPYIGGFVVLVFMFMEGTRGPNRYGPDPKAENMGQVFS